MFDDSTANTSSNRNPDVLSNVPSGTAVYDTNGDKVGNIVEYDSQAGYMVVEKGWLFHTDLYVPLTLISNTDDQAVYLKISKDDLKADQYTNPPTGYALGGSGNTSPTTYDTASYDTSSTTYAGTGAAGYAGVAGQDVAATTGGYTSQAAGGYTGQVNDLQDQDLGSATVGADLGTPTDTVNYAGRPSTQDQTTATWNTQTAGATNQAAFGTSTNDIQVPVREEELVAGTRVEEEGRVRIHKEVVEEQETINVPVRRERVVVERVPASGEVTDGDLDTGAFKGDDIEIPVMREEVVVGKRVQQVESVRIHKDVVNDTEQVSDTVRKERVLVDGAEDLDQTDSTTTGSYRNQTDSTTIDR
jgi:uncharacterized protein (TIGR02271 family)